MLKTLDLLDAAKKAQCITSDYRLAQLLGADQSTVTGWRRGRSHPVEPMQARLSVLAGIDPRLALLWLRIERARDPIERELWGQLVDVFEASGAPPLHELPARVDIVLPPLPRHIVAVDKPRAWPAELELVPLSRS